MTPSTASPTAARASISTIFFINGFGYATWVSRIPAVRHALQLTEGELGTVLFAIAGGALVAFPPAGRSVAASGARVVTLAASLVYCLVLPGPAWAGNLILLGLALFLFGATSGAMDVSMNALAVEVETLIGKRIMSSVHGMWSAGALAGALVGSLAARLNISPQVHLTGIAAVLALSVWMAKRWLPPSRPHPCESLPYFAFPEAGMFGLGIIIFCNFLVGGALAGWGAVFLHDALNTTAAVAAVGYAVYSLTMMIMRFVGDRAVNRWGAVELLRGFNTIAAVALMAALWSGGVGITMLAFSVIGVAVATVAPLVFRAAGHRSRHGAGHGIAAMATLGYAGSLLGPPIIGWLAQATSLRVALLVIVVMLVLIAVFAHHLREHR